LPSPKTDSVILLPTETTYRKVHYDFIISQQGEGDFKLLKYGIFLKLWHKLTPQIQIMKIRTDLCNTCHQLRNEIHSCKDEIVKQELKKNLKFIKTKSTKKETTITKTKS